MKLTNKDLPFVLNSKKWQVPQDALAIVTNMAIITVDYRGIPITTHSSCSEFCKRVRAVPELSAKCQKCDSRGGIEAARLQKPFIYRCHANVVDAAVPIIVNNSYLGAIMIGQILLTDEQDEGELELICASSRESLVRHIGNDIYLMDQLPRLSLERVKAIVDMLFHLCSFIVEGAVEKNFALEMSLLNAKLKPDNTASTNKVIKPALDYINTRQGERCSLAEMAALCHVSQSYFSKLFLREMGETYSSYLLQARIRWAKELLSTTNRQIGEIATMVGFSDDGHFIRSFKKYEGITPARFRKLLGN